MSGQLGEKIFVIYAHPGKPKMLAQASVIYRNPNVAVLDFSAGVLAKGQVVGFPDCEWSEMTLAFPVTIEERES